MDLANSASAVVQSALCAKASQSLAQTLMVSANPGLERSPDYQAHKHVLKGYFDLKLHDAFKELIQSDFDDKINPRARLFILESYTPMVVNSLWPLLLWYQCKNHSRRDSNRTLWPQFLEAAILRNDIPSLKLLAIDIPPAAQLSEYMSEVLLDKTDSKQLVLEWLLKHYSSWTPTLEDFIAAAASSKGIFELLQQHNLRALTIRPATKSNHGNTYP
jgi:hypothetical protein